MGRARGLTVGMAMVAVLGGGCGEGPAGETTDVPGEEARSPVPGPSSTVGTLEREQEPSTLELPPELPPPPDECVPHQANLVRSEARGRVTRWRASWESGYLTCVAE